jgi:hypothetical protein
LVITPYISILYMMSITLLLVVLGVRSIPVVFLNYYGYAGFGTADLKAASERFARERGIRCWNESCTGNI